MAKRVICLEAKKENLQKLLKYFDIDTAQFAQDVEMLMKMALEEIFVNIAMYAYGQREGMVTITSEIEEIPKKRMIFTFIDSGIPYNPWNRENPQLDIGLMDRKIGGLGVYMAKESMDEVYYKYKDGNNVLTMIKNF